MRVPDGGELLTLWERGVDRHPIDRALLLGVWARPDLAPERLAELPLGALHSALLRLRVACFGTHLDAFADCTHCGSRAALALAVDELLSASVDGDDRDELRIAGFRFRVPDSRDLAAVAATPDPTAAPLALLDQCCVERPHAGSDADLAALMADVEAGLELLDPAADFEFLLDCQVCGGEWTASLNVADLLWDEIGGQARVLLGQVHALAAAYGWTENEVLSLSPRRRATYMELVDG